MLEWRERDGFCLNVCLCVCFSLYIHVGWAQFGTWLWAKITLSRISDRGTLTSKKLYLFRPCGGFGQRSRLRKFKLCFQEVGYGPWLKNEDSGLHADLEQLAKLLLRVSPGVPEFSMELSCCPRVITTGHHGHHLVRQHGQESQELPVILRRRGGRGTVVERPATESSSSSTGPWQ